MWHRWGSGRQGRESSGVKVPMPSVARFGRLAYPLLGEVTNRDMRGRKSHDCPACPYKASCGRSDLGGEQTWRPEHKEITVAPRSHFHTEVAVWIFCEVPSRSRCDEGRCLLGRNGYMHQEDHRGMGASIWGKIRGDNAGKGQLPAGTRNNLQRLIDQE